MPLSVQASKPNTLLANIKKAIDNKHIVTWKYDEDGDFTHTPADGQWTNKAWFRPSIGSSLLTFNIFGQKGITLADEVYAVYHGRFTEMLLAHFRSEFTIIVCST